MIINGFSSDVNYVIRKINGRLRLWGHGLGTLLIIALNLSSLYFSTHVDYYLKNASWTYGRDLSVISHIECPLLCKPSSSSPRSLSALEIPPTAMTDPSDSDVIAK